jgi:hypothetical protein
LNAAIIAIDVTDYLNTHAPNIASFTKKIPFVRVMIAAINVEITRTMDIVTAVYSRCI